MMGIGKIGNFIFSSFLIFAVLQIFILGNAEAETIAEIKKILASDGKEADNFGFSIAVSGDTMVVGAINAEGVEVDSGAAYVFQKDSNGTNNWGEVKKIIPSETGPFSQFGYSVGISGDIIVVGNQNREVAFVFYRNQGGSDNWGEVKRINATSVLLTDRFGAAVSIFGNTTVVGSPGDDIARGSAYIFQKDFGGADNWGEVKRITAFDSEVGDRFGESVAIYNDTIVVGADQGLSPLANDPGFGYVFQRDFNGSNAWGLIKKLDPSDVLPGDRFGKSVSIYEDIIVVGAYSGFPSSQGNAYVFEKDLNGTNNWGQVKKLKASDAFSGELFGWAVSIYDDTILIGAKDDDIIFDQGAGSAYVFEQDFNGTNNWGQVTKLIASDVESGDEFGFSVGLSGDNFVIGARGNDDNGSRSGSAYVFGKVLDPCTPPQSGIWTINSSCLISTSVVFPENVVVQANAVVTIQSGGVLNISSDHKITIESGGGILIESGGTLRVTV